MREARASHSGVSGASIRASALHKFEALGSHLVEPESDKHRKRTFEGPSIEELTLSLIGSAACGLRTHVNSK